MRLLFVLFLNSLFVSLSQKKFNVFKSYKDASSKPENYSKEKKYLRHSINEYLNIDQQKMYDKRYSKDNPKDLFDANWSGYTRVPKK